MNCVAAKCKKTARCSIPITDAEMGNLCAEGWFIWDRNAPIAWHGVALCPAHAKTDVGQVLQTVHAMAVRSRGR